MKKLLYFLLLVPTLIWSQERRFEREKDTIVYKDSIYEARTTVSAFVLASEPGQYGISFEDEKEGGMQSGLFNLAYGSMTYKNTVLGDLTGNGFVIELGARRYHRKRGVKTGLYAENFISYGAIKFDESTPTEKFEGTYSYWSLINPNIGYKLIISDHFVIEPSVGANWKWEVRGKGDVDNKDFFNIVLRAGVKVGYRF